MTVNTQLEQENNPQKLCSDKAEIPLFTIANMSLPLSCYNFCVKAWSWNAVCQCIFFG